MMVSRRKRISNARSSVRKWVANKRWQIEDWVAKKKGLRLYYHGTSKSSAKNIRKHGFSPDKVVGHLSGKPNKKVIFTTTGSNKSLSPGLHAQLFARHVEQSQYLNNLMKDTRIKNKFLKHSLTAKQAKSYWLKDTPYKGGGLWKYTATNRYEWIGADLPKDKELRKYIKSVRSIKRGGVVIVKQPRKQKVNMYDYLTMKNVNLSDIIGNIG
jgi:hypothetical protein